MLPDLHTDFSRGRSGGPCSIHIEEMGVRGKSFRVGMGTTPVVQCLAFHLQGRGCGLIPGRDSLVTQLLKDPFASSRLQFYPWGEEILWRRNRLTPQYSCLEKSTNKGVWLQSMGSQRIGQNWVTELNCTM